MYCALDNTSDYYSNPAVVVVHGGGFVSGNRASMSLFSYVVAHQGFTVFNIDYRLSPPGGTSRFPDAVNDIQAAVTRVRQNGSNYNASVNKIGTMGVSAGGTLGMMAGLLGETGKEKADVIVSWSGPTAFDRGWEFMNELKLVEGNNHGGELIGQDPVWTESLAFLRQYLR